MTEELGLLYKLNWPELGNRRTTLVSHVENKIANRKLKIQCSSYGDPKSFESRAQNKRIRPERCEKTGGPKKEFHMKLRLNSLLEKSRGAKRGDNCANLRAKLRALMELARNPVALVQGTQKVNLKICERSSPRWVGGEGKDLTCVVLIRGPIEVSEKTIGSSTDKERSRRLE